VIDGGTAGPTRTRRPAVASAVRAALYHVAKEIGMASNGIKDRVAIVGMGCTPFGEHWDKGPDDLLVDAAKETYQSAGVDPGQVDAYWLGTMGSGTSGLMLSEALKIPYKPVTRLENMCATGSEAIRNAAYAVASGAYDLVMAIGVEKLKDSGYSGLIISNPPNDGTLSNMTAPATFSLLAPAYAKKYGVDETELKHVLARIAWKNHKNGARNPKAQFRKEVPIETITRSAPVAGMLGIFDCSGVSDGAAAAILCRAEDAHKYSKHPIFIKALSFAAGPAEGYYSQDYDFTTFPEVVASSQDAYAQAGVTDPRTEVSMAEVHDCFTATELVLMEDMGFSPRGTGWRDILDGRFDGDGPQPINPDGGLKSFGHPIGASGLRMMYEMWLQLRGEAGPRQIKDPKLGMTHNLGGAPGRCVSFVSIVGV
jgi:acetyl-CoA C-acetyltransferase